MNKKQTKYTHIDNKTFYKLRVFCILQLIRIFVNSQLHQDHWGKTIVSYETDKPVRLPILDVALRDIGKPEQSFSIEIGAACYD